GKERDMFYNIDIQKPVILAAFMLGSVALTSCMLADDDNATFDGQIYSNSPIRGDSYTSRIFVDPAAQASWLGRGVESVTGRTGEPCVMGDVVEYNNRTMTVSFQSNKTARQSLEELSGQISGKIDLVLFGGSGSVSMHSRLEDQHNTASVVLRVSYKGKTLRLENRTLTERGKAVVGQSVAHIAETCGDQYIDHLQYGNELYVVAQMVFASRAEYESFITRVKFRALFWSVTHTFSKEFYDQAYNGLLSVKVLSPNDLPGPIRTALGGKDEMSCKASSPSNLDACLDAGNQVIEYILGNSGGYADWLRNEDNLGVSWYASSNYEATGHREFAGVTAPVIDGLRVLHDRILNLLITEYRRKNVAQAYAGSPVPNQSVYRAMVRDIDENIAVLEQAMDTCQSSLDADTCESAIDDARGRLISIDLSM
ncbi:MAG: hypothetical protein AAGC55_15145, partial [Myxococcota bacterium]